MSNQSDPRPTFKETRQQHDLSLSQVYEDAIAHGAQITFHAAEFFDQFGVGEPTVIDALLASLSRLTGTEYNRLNIGSIFFTPTPPDTSP